MNGTSLVEQIYALVEGETKTVNERIRSQIGNVLTSIFLLKCSLDGEGKDDAQSSIYLANIQENIQYIIKSSWEMENSLTAPQPFVLQEFLESIAGHFSALHAPNLDVKIKSSYTRPLYITGIKQRIFTAIEHVIQNAVTAMSDQGVITIELKAIREDRDGGCIEIDILDTGCGIPQCKRDFIFELGTSYWSDETRTGLGLWLARNIVRDAHGDLRVKETTIGEGTTFSVMLPIKKPSSDEVSPVSTKDNSRDETPDDGHDSPYSNEGWYVPSNWQSRAISDKFEKFKESFKADVVIMTANDIEFRYACHALKPPSNKRRIRCIRKGSQTYYAGKFANFSTVVLQQAEQGSGGGGGSLMTANNALNLWKPKALIMVGIAWGANRNTHKPADVLIAKKIYCYEKSREGENEVIYRGDSIPCGQTLFDRFKNRLAWNFLRPDGSQVNCYDGAMLSGEKLIDNPDFKKKLLEQYPETIGGEMEGAGISAVGQLSKLDWIVVKAVCDWADGDKNDTYQEIAAAAAVSLTHSVLSDENALRDLHNFQPGVSI